MEENADDFHRLKSVCVFTLENAKVTCRIRNHGNAHIRMMEGEKAMKEYCEYR